MFFLVVSDDFLRNSLLVSVIAALTVESLDELARGLELVAADLKVVMRSDIDRLVATAGCEESQWRQFRHTLTSDDPCVGSSTNRRHGQG